MVMLSFVHVHLIGPLLLQLISYGLSDSCMVRKFMQWLGLYTGATTNYRGTNVLQVNA